MANILSLQSASVTEQAVLVAPGRKPPRPVLSRHGSCDASFFPQMGLISFLEEFSSKMSQNFKISSDEKWTSPRANPFMTNGLIFYLFQCEDSPWSCGM